MPWHPQILADQLTLFQLGGTDYAQLITTGIQRFSDLPSSDGPGIDCIMVILSLVDEMIELHRIQRPIPNLNFHEFSDHLEQVLQLNIDYIQIHTTLIVNTCHSAPNSV